MNTLDAIRARRSIKHYDPNFTIPEEDEKTLKELIKHSPTSYNMQNWRIVTVKNKELQKKIRAAGMNQAHIEECSLLFILCADVKAWEKDPVSKTWQDAEPKVQDIYAPMIKGFYEKNEWQQRDEAIRSIALAAQTLMLASTAMNYQTCPMIGFDAEALGELINLPEDYIIGMMVTVGKGIQPAWTKPGWLPDNEVFFEDTF